MSSIRAHARSIEAKDPYTAGHCDRVERYAEIIARQHGGFSEKGFSSFVPRQFSMTSAKSAWMAKFSANPGLSTHASRDEIRSHPMIGGRIVRSLYGYDLEPIVRHHHERFDGTGYPSGLKGDRFPLNPG